jgi:hypothetical protein
MRVVEDRARWREIGEAVPVDCSGLMMMKFFCTEARLGAAETSAGPLRILKPRRDGGLKRPPTPTVEAVDDGEEARHQAALVVQTLIRGRAVQNLVSCPK